jgi:urease accessory protein
MLLVSEILGSLCQPRFAGRRVERLPVDWAAARKRRLRALTDAGTDIALDLPHGTYLADGAVLHDDGERVVAVGRTEEPALVVRFDPGLPAAELAGQAARLGHAFGNQHVPLDVEDGAIRVPVTTSEQVARDTVSALGLLGISVNVELVALGAHTPVAKGHGHG